MSYLGIISQSDRIAILSNLSELQDPDHRQGLSGQGAYSVISRIEVLCFEQSLVADTKAKRVLSRLIELSLTSEIAERTIILRKRFRIKVPDAIIAATALLYSLQFVTRNQDDFVKVEDLRLIVLNHS